MDLASESESDEEGKDGEGGCVVVAGVTPRMKKHGTSVFQVAIKDTQFKNTQRIL
jgi:hypothetical protein